MLIAAHWHEARKNISIAFKVLIFSGFNFKRDNLNSWCGFSFRKTPNKISLLSEDIYWQSSHVIRKRGKLYYLNFHTYIVERIHITIF